MMLKIRILHAGKREKITITNNKDRLSQEEIERLVAEAEEYAEEDKKTAGKVSARNSLETYLYNLKNQMGDKLGLASWAGATKSNCFQVKAVWGMGIALWYVGTLLDMAKLKLTCCSILFTTSCVLLPTLFYKNKKASAPKSVDV